MFRHRKLVSLRGAEGDVAISFRNGKPTERCFMPNNQGRKPKSVLREWVESILIALVLAMLIRSYFVQPFKIPSGSMRMTLIEGDHLFVDKWTYGPQLVPPMFWDIGFQERGVRCYRSDGPMPCCQ